MKKGLLNKVTSLVLTFVMVLGMLTIAQPVSAQASDTAGTQLTTTLNFYKDIAGQFAFNNFNSELKSYTGTYTGPVLVNGVESTVTCYLTESLFHTGVLADLNDGKVESIAIATGATFTRNDGAVAITVTRGITCTPPASYGTDSYDADRTNWTAVLEPVSVALDAKYYEVNTSVNQIQYNVQSTGGGFSVSDFILGGSARGWYDCVVKIDGVDTTVQAFLGTNSSSSTTLETVRFGDSGGTAMATAIANGSTITIPKEIVFTKSGYVITVNCGNEQVIKCTDGSWVAEATPNTATFGLAYSGTTTEQIVYNLTDNKADFVDDYSQKDNMRGWYTIDVVIGEENATVQAFLGDGVCIIGNKSDAILAAISAGTTITIPETVTATTTNATTANYVITLNFGEEQKLGMANGSYGVLPTELATEIAFYKDINGTLAYTIVSEEVIAEFAGQSFTGSITINGTATDVIWTVSGNCLVIGGVINEDVERIQVIAGTKLVNEAGDSITLNSDLVNDKPDNYGAEDYDPTNWPKKPDPHVHAGVKTDAVAATCTTNGNIAYWTCECGKIYANEACTEEIALEETVIAATGHKYGAGKVTKAATCEKNGVMTYTCTCGATKTSVIKAVGKPAATKVTKATGGKKKITIKFKKVSSIGGYQIQIATKKNMKKGLKTYKVSVSKAKYVAKKLKAKTTYYVRIRTYKTAGGETSYSAWSKKVKVKTK